MIVLGIDPGLETTGYAVVAFAGRQATVRETGLIRSGGAQTPLAERLLEIHASLVQVVQQHRPMVMAMEEVFSHAEYPRTAILMGHARGVIALVAAQAGLELHNYDATRVKSLLTGNGQAGKAEVQRAVAFRLGLSKLPAPDHVADALAMALVYGESGGSRRLQALAAGGGP